MSKLEEYFDSTAAILQARYEKSHAINHNLSKGECRETLIENFLSEMYPDRYCFGDGEIIDSSGNVSKQSDIVIYDDRLPVLEYEGSKHFFSEGVLAHIEVKSNLSGEFENALNNVESVKNLHQNNDNTLAMGNQSNGIFSCIFAFEGPEWTKFSEKTRDYYYTNISGEEYKKSVPMVDTVCTGRIYICPRKWKQLRYVHEQSTFTIFYCAHECDQL